MKVKFGMMITDGRNKLGDVVYSRNHYGVFSRAWVIPANPNTTYQQSVRTNFGTLANTWKGLTDLERNQWISAAYDYARTNNLAEHEISTGFNFYMFINNNLTNAGMLPTSIPIPKSLPIAIPPLSMTANAALNQIILTINPVLPATSDHIIYRSTAPLSPGIMRAFAQYRQIIALPNPGGSGGNIYLPWHTKYGALVSGQKIFMKVFTVSTSGYTSVPQSCSAIVV